MAALLYELLQVQLVSYLFLFLCNLVPMSSQLYDHQCHPKESIALLEFKNSFSKLSTQHPYRCQNWETFDRTSTWNESIDCCKWDGVECDDDDEGEGGHVVVGLHLGCSLLYGTLDPNSTLFTLSHLQTLNLSSNYLDGSPFSPQFGIMLTNLRVLDLSGCHFRGDVPLQISHLSKLVSLHLSDNFHLRFSNMVMNQLVRNLTNLKNFELAFTNLSIITPSNSFINFSLSLQSLDLSSFCFSLYHNCLSGYFPADHILSLPNLRVLQLQGNTKLNGHLPMMTNWSKSLESLDLSKTNFSGGIPISIGEVKALRYLDLSYCNFNGEIPELYGNLQLRQPPHFLKFTQQPSFSNNNSFANVCSYTFPNLTYLGLTSNSFSGNIPTWLYMLPTLAFLDLSNNHFSGFIKDFRSNSLEYLLLSDNKFQGQVSNSIYTQLNLIDLGLSFNNLSGVLNLDMLAKIPTLSSLDISNNTQLSVFSSSNTSSSSNLSIITMASLNLEKVPYFLRNQNKLLQLNLSNNQIRGKIPRWFSELDSLVLLDLSHNFLSSGIEVLRSMHNLEFVLLDYNLFSKLPIPTLLPSTIYQFSVSNNKLRGNVHPSICQATRLSILDLSNNNLSGALPSCLSNFTSLETLILKSNNFSGVIPIPPNIRFYIASENQFIGEIPLSICHALKLAILSLSNNNMSGIIPPCFTNITSLLVLNLKGNNFSGTIPTFSSTKCQLISIDLNDNQIEEELPQSLLNCENLEVLDLGNNKLTGHFPYWLEFASKLRVLILQSNQFYGHINNSFNNDGFLNLRIIDLSHNNFSGSLPSNFFKNMKAIKEVENPKSQSYYEPFRSYYKDSIKISSKGLEQEFERILSILKTIDLSSNNFNGEIPEEIGILRSLVGLKLSHNKLTGEIPTSLGNLTNLEWLDLSSNELLGSIPLELTALTFLSFLNLSQNHLSGRIPQSKQFNTFENSSYFGNFGLCGTPLPECDHAHKKDHSSKEEESESLVKMVILKAVFMGYGCGMIFGIFIGYLVFKCGKPKWIVAIVEAKKATKIHTNSRKTSRPRKRN